MHCHIRLLRSLYMLFATSVETSVSITNERSVPLTSKLSSELTSFIDVANMIIFLNFFLVRFFSAGSNYMNYHRRHLGLLLLHFGLLFGVEMSFQRRRRLAFVRIDRFAKIASSPGLRCTAGENFQTTERNFHSNGEVTEAYPATGQQMRNKTSVESTKAATTTETTQVSCRHTVTCNCE